jgi:hypothetical protein
MNVKIRCLDRQICRPICSQARVSAQSRVMQTNFERKPLDQIEADALIVLVAEGAKESRFGAAALCEAGEVAGKSQEFTLLHNAPGVAAKRVLLAGTGKADKFDSAGMRNLIGAAVRFRDCARRNGHRSRFHRSRGGRRHSGRLRTGSSQNLGR